MGGWPSQSFLTEIPLGWVGGCVVHIYIIYIYTCVCVCVCVYVCIHIYAFDVQLEALRRTSMRP